MSFFQRRSAFYFGFAIERSLCVIALLTFVLSGLLGGKVLAGEGMLRFEKTTPQEVDAYEALSNSGARKNVESVKGRENVKKGMGADVPAVSMLAQKHSSTYEYFSHSEKELREIFLRAVLQAAERSPTIKQALAEQSAARADIDEAKGQRLPQVDVGARSKSRAFGSGDGSESNGQSFGIDVITPVFDWGRIRKTIESRSYLANASDAALQAELESSAFEVSSNLIELGKQRIIVDISTEYVKRTRELVTMLEGIVAVDSGRVSELTQARSRLLQAEAQRSTAESSVRDVEINLHKMIGERPLPPLPSSSRWDIRLPDLDWLLLESAKHPVIMQAQAQARSADLEAEVVRSSALPQVNWVVGKNTVKDALGRESAWQTNLIMSWSAFRGGSLRAKERAALQRAEASRQGAEQQVLDLEYRIRASNHDALKMLERADLYKGLTVESNQVREAFYDQWYHLGKRTLLDVLISESDHHGNQVSEVANRFDGYAAIIRQYASSGVLLRWLNKTNES